MKNVYDFNDNEPLITGQLIILISGQLYQSLHFVCVVHKLKSQLLRQVPLYVVCTVCLVLSTTLFRMLSLVICQQTKPAHFYQVRIFE